MVTTPFNRYAKRPALKKEYGKSLTKTEFTKDANINQIIKKHDKTGILGNPLTACTIQPQFGDMTNSITLYDMQLKLKTAGEEFLALPTKIRDRFHNDPGELIDFMSNPDNKEEAIKLGLLPQPKRVRLTDEQIAAEKLAAAKKLVADSEKPPEEKTTT